jgi:hypothetical protein
LRRQCGRSASEISAIFIVFPALTGALMFTGFPAWLSPVIYAGALNASFSPNIFGKIKKLI